MKKIVKSDAAFKFIQKTSKKIKTYPRLIFISKFGFVFIIFFLLCNGRVDPDFGWHLQAGNYFLKHGIPEFDVFTYTATNFHWINHEWLSDVLLSIVYGWGGHIALSACYALLWTGALLISGRRASMVALLLATSAMLSFAGIRPLAWTVVFFALLLSLGATNNHKHLKFIPILFIFWANIHGGFIAGLALLAYFAIKYRQRVWAYVFIASVLVTFINPYGLQLYTEIYRTLFDGSLSQDIAEWHRFRIPPSAIPFVIVWTTGFLFLESKKVNSWLKPASILFFASMAAIRNTPLFVIASLSDIDDFYNRFAQKIPDGGNKNIAFAKKFVLGGLIVLVLAKMAVANIHFFSSLSDREYFYPRESVAYIKLNGCPGQLFNAYNYGGYLIWKLPDYPVYIDGRMPSWRDQSGSRYFDIYKSAIQTESTQQSEFEKHDIRCALLQKDQSMVDNLKNLGWKVAIEENTAILLIKPE